MTARWWSVAAALVLGTFVLAPVQPAAAQTGAMIQPVGGIVTGVLSNRCGSTDSDHYGVDIAGNGGMAIGAAYPGTVTFAGYTSGGGNTVHLSHASGYVTKYLHMVQAPSVGVGQSVGQGQVLGYVGSTGNSTGPHLHFEIWRNGGLYNISPAYTCRGTVTKGAAINLAFADLPSAGGAGPMYHQARLVNGAWTGFQPLNGYQTTSPGMAKDVAIAGMPDSSAQVVIVGVDNTIYHRIRNASGTWSAFQPLNGTGTTSPAQGSRVAIAGMPNGTAQVLIAGANGVVYHRIRNTNGTWSEFQPLNGSGTTSGAVAKDVAIAAMPDNSAQVVIVGVDNTIYHRIRSANGTWSQFQPLNGSGTTSPAQGSAVSITGMPDGSAQVVIAGAGGGLYHRIRNANGAWSEFQPLNGVGTTTTAIAKDVAIAGMSNGSAQVFIIGVDNSAYHRIRNANSTWTQFGAVQGVGTTAAAKGSRVSISGLPDLSAQVMFVGE